MNLMSVHERIKPKGQLKYVRSKKTPYAPTRSHTNISHNISTILPSSCADITKKQIKIQPHQQTKYYVSSEWVKQLKKQINNILKGIQKFVKQIQGQMKAMQKQFITLIQCQIEKLGHNDMDESKISSIQQKEEKYQRDFTDLPINGNLSLISQKFYYTPKNRDISVQNEEKGGQQKKVLNRTLSLKQELNGWKKMDKFFRKPDKSSQISSLSFYKGRDKRVNDSMQGFTNCIISMKKLVQFDSKQF